MRLGKREVDALACPSGKRDILIFDDELTGFAVRVTSAGSKVWLLQYWQAGRVRRVRLGAYGDITPAAARKLAEAERGRVQSGADPAAERQAKALANAEAAKARKIAKAADRLTLGALIADWERLRLADRRERYRAEATRALRLAFASRLDQPAHAITSAELRRDFDKMAATRGATMARRTHAYGRAAFAWAMKRDLVPCNPFVAVTVEGREVARDRVLSDREIGEVWRAAGTLGWPYGPFVRVLMLTLQREAETAGMRWGELAGDLSAWTLPGDRAKNGRAHLVHLAEPVQRELDLADSERTKRAAGCRSAAKRRKAAGDELVFTTTGRSPISGFAKAKLRLDAAIVAERAEMALAAGVRPDPLAPWRFHDLRRTGVTVLAREGVRWEVADRLLNHVSGAIRGVAAIYQRHDFISERASASLAWADHVLSVAVPQRAEARVVRLRPAKAAP